MSNNLLRKISNKEIIFGFSIILVVLLPRILVMIFPSNSFFLLISKDQGWYIYLFVVLVIVISVERLCKKWLRQS